MKTQAQKLAARSLELEAALSLVRELEEGRAAIQAETFREAAELCRKRTMDHAEVFNSEGGSDGYYRGRMHEARDIKKMLLAKAETSQPVAPPGQYVETLQEENRKLRTERDEDETRHEYACGHIRELEAELVSVKCHHSDLATHYAAVERELNGTRRLYELAMAEKVGACAGKQAAEQRAEKLATIIKKAKQVVDDGHMNCVQFRAELRAVLEAAEKADG